MSAEGRVWTYVSADILGLNGTVLYQVNVITSPMLLFCRVSYLSYNVEISFNDRVVIFFCFRWDSPVVRSSCAIVAGYMTSGKYLYFVLFVS